MYENIHNLRIQRILQCQIIVWFKKKSILFLQKNYIYKTYLGDYHPPKKNIDYHPPKKNIKILVSVNKWYIQKYHTLFGCRENCI